jgi:transposase-like protein
MKLYSKDLRFRMLAAVDRGMARKEVARTFDVPEPTIRRYLRLRRRTGGFDPKPPAGPPPRKDAALDDALPAQVSRNPDLTLEEHREPSMTSEALRSVSAASAAPSGAWGCRSKKVPPGLRARRRGTGALAREGGRTRPTPVGVRGRVRDARLHDPSQGEGAHRLEAFYGFVHRNRGRNTTLLASMTHEGMGPCLAVVGSTAKAVFEAYVEKFLAPSLRPGQVLVLDNLGIHRSERVRDLIARRGAVSFCLCQPTRRTSSRSGRPSASSRRCFGRPPHAHAGRR